MKEVAVHQIVDLLKTANEELAYCRFIATYPGVNGFKHFDNAERIDTFYKRICNICFHDALLIVASLLDGDNRVISFWNWQPFIEHRKSDLEKIATRFQSSPLQMVRDQITAHSDLGNHNNNFPSARRVGMIDARLVGLLQGYLDEMTALFHLFTREIGLAQPRMTKADMI